MQNVIEYFKIKKLFGNRDVTIKFSDNIMLLIGENGIGKTTILNIFYFAVTARFDKLNKLPFEWLEIGYGNGQKFRIEKSSLNIFSINEGEYGKQLPKIVGYINYINEHYSSEEKDDIKRIFSSASPKNQKARNKFIEDFSTKIESFRLYTRRILSIIFENNFYEIIENSEKIKNSLNAEIFYFPTYRRIEEELRNLGMKEARIESDSRIIKFGMQDVKETWDKKLEEIKNTSIEGFNKITGELLHQYLKGAPKLHRGIKSKLKDNVHNIILERVGDNIDIATKKKIKYLVETKEIFQDKYNYLLNLLSHLIKIYDRQKELDNRLKTFAKICSDYLYKKEIIYNESKVTLDVFNEKLETLELKYLSSGEKQVISLFTKLYLEYSHQYIVLFDEPELSLSIEWQRKLLPDIISSGRCKFLLAVTHSPFIFDNDLVKYAKDLNRYVK